MSKFNLQFTIYNLQLALLVMLASCNPEARYETKNVEIRMSIQTVSAGFIECDFSTNKGAYYLIACVPAEEGVDPTKNPKQFMTLALDSANREYLDWRNDLLKKGEFNIAPFASHALHYGDINHCFTGLWFSQDYWVYAFVVDPVAMKPVGKLYLEKVTTEFESIMSIRFDYRIKGLWDYIYPMDSLSGAIQTHFPYVTVTCDSVDLDAQIMLLNSLDIYSFVSTPQEYFAVWLLNLSANPEEKVDILYGVSARENDGYSSPFEFQEGHTYYTFIGGYDFSIRQNTLYKYRWEGDSTELYFSEKDNIAWEDYSLFGDD